MTAECTRLQCRGNETQHPELKTAAAADNKLCSFVKFRGTNKSSTSGFQLATGGWLLLALQYLIFMVLD